MADEVTLDGLRGRDGDGLVPVDLSSLGPAQIVFVDGLPCLRVDDEVRQFELRLNGSAESERAALQLALSVWRLANVSYLLRLERDADDVAVGAFAALCRATPGAAAEQPGGVGLVTATRRPPMRADTKRRPAP